MKSKALLLAGAVAVASLANANITFHEVAYWDEYVQTSDAQPVTPSYGSFTARVFANTANEVTTGTVTLPNASTRPITPFGSTVAGFVDNSFANHAAAMAAYGTGTFLFSLNAGPHTGASDFVSYGNPGWADAVPYLTGATYSSLQTLDPTQAFTFQWSPFSAGGDHTSLQSYFQVFDLTAGTTLFSSQGNPASFTSKMFGAGTFVGGHDYQYRLVFGALTQGTSTGDFTGSRATATTYAATNGYFTAVPEPSTMALAAAGLAALIRRRKASR